MTRHSDQRRRQGGREGQGGFTLVEVLLAIVVLLVGIVAVAQLVPASIGSNATNRNDSGALVFAQRQMDLFLSQPLNMSIAPPSFSETIDGQTYICSLGDPTQPNQAVGNPVLVINNQLIIDFNNPSPTHGVTGYSFMQQDPNDPFGAQFDVRWAVITTTNGGMVSAKRFILGVRKKGGNGFYKPVTIDTILEK